MYIIYSTDKTHSRTYWNNEWQRDTASTLEEALGIAVYLSKKDVSNRENGSHYIVYQDGEIVAEVENGEKK